MPAPREYATQKEVDTLKRQLERSERNNKLTRLQAYIDQSLWGHPDATQTAFKSLIVKGIITTMDIRTLSRRNSSYAKFKSVLDHIVGVPIDGINMWAKIDRGGAGRNRHTYWIDILKHGKSLGVAIDGYKKMMKYPDAHAKSKHEKIDQANVFLDVHLQKNGIPIVTARKACEDLNKIFVHNGEPKCMKRLNDGRWAKMY